MSTENDATGCIASVLTAADAVFEHPLSSVTVRLYSPPDNPTNVVSLDPVFHSIVYGGSPPLILTVAVPSFIPSPDSGVVLIIGIGSSLKYTLTELEAVQPYEFVTISS